jgi:hypothetical protein
MQEPVDQVALVVQAEAQEVPDRVERVERVNHS